MFINTLGYCFMCMINEMFNCDDRINKRQN